MTLTGADYVGWLLRANRRLGAGGELRSGRVFAEAYRTDGRPRLAPSHVTRWENGDLPAGRDVVRRYEHLLGLEPESLVTVRDALYRTLPDAGRPPPGRSPSGDRALHELLDLARSRHPLTGTQWGELTDLVGERPGLVLHPPGLWRGIGEKLLADLTLSEGTGWLQRQEAASRLLEHPAAGPHLIEACIDLVEDPRRPAVIEPLSLLDVSADPVANAYVLKQLEAPDSDRHHQGALLAAVRKIENGHFQGEQWEQLSRLLGHTGATGEAGRLLGAAHRAYTREVEETVTAEGRRVADEVTSGEHDPVLAALVSTALDGPAVDRRVFAAMTIAQTPFREPVAGVLLDGCRRDLARRGGGDPTRALQTMTMLGTGVHRPLLLDLLTGPGHDLAVRRAAAWAMPHCGGSFTEQQWRLILARQRDGHVLHGVTYGIGTDGHRRLLGEIANDPVMPEIARATARWLKPHS
ncbi:hypothetical protein [Paractinoplanes atraurantiacus]|uniref:Uncharacterized protein n=1 Tax=Paractinoplanes atraurantiacus TaxID=1036182 RepID=A0A285KIM2_9ACTN|nr:hypothetical protein [Actinoplanes atraurantiacus]SNY71151.1 hypothetical protein SAMN05421748_13935 [Actinoplanes atraurantiacus]